MLALVGFLMLREPLFVGKKESAWFKHGNMPYLAYPCLEGRAGSPLLLILLMLSLCTVSFFFLCNAPRGYAKLNKGGSSGIFNLLSQWDLLSYPCSLFVGAPRVNWNTAAFGYTMNPCNDDTYCAESSFQLSNILHADLAKVVLVAFHYKDMFKWRPICQETRQSILTKICCRASIPSASRSEQRRARIT